MCKPYYFLTHIHRGLPKIPKHKLNTPHSVGVLKKKKSRLVSTRLGEEDAKILEEITREENIVKATLENGS